MKAAQTSFLAFLAIFLAFSLVRNILSYREKVKFYNSLKSEYTESQNTNKQLKSDLKSGTDYFVIERQIREKLNLLQDDEESFIIPKLTPIPTPTPAVVLKPYQQWWNLAVGKVGS